jgi:hypothetical protein
MYSIRIFVLQVIIARQEQATVIRILVLQIIFVLKVLIVLKSVLMVHSLIHLKYLVWCILKMLVYFVIQDIMQVLLGVSLVQRVLCVWVKRKLSIQLIVIKIMVMSVLLVITVLKEALLKYPVPSAPTEIRRKVNRLIVAITVLRTLSMTELDNQHAESVERVQVHLLEVQPANVKEDSESSLRQIQVADVSLDFTKLNTELKIAKMILRSTANLMSTMTAKITKYTTTEANALRRMIVLANAVVVQGVIQMIMECVSAMIYLLLILYVMPIVGITHSRLQ